MTGALISEETAPTADAVEGGGEEGGLADTLDALLATNEPGRAGAGHGDPAAPRPGK